MLYPKKSKLPRKQPSGNTSNLKNTQKLKLDQSSPKELLVPIMKNSLLDNTKANELINLDATLPLPRNGNHAQNDEEKETDMLRKPIVENDLSN